ncbi:hypothetical protein BGZ57DRAFT_967627 [Hyaloscypha finlandica]|nr:hypothetical protein BGZ57DRAFT_967627 [Hyaloscypha finlandica]
MPLTPGGGGPAMLLPPDVNYPYLPAPQQAQQPLSEDEVIDADANFDFSSHQRPFRTNASKAEKAKQEQEELAQVKEQDSTNTTPKLTRCEQCKKDKKGCDLGETGYPCTRCKTRKVLCVGCDTPIRLRLPPKKTKRKPKPNSGMSTQPATGNDMATTPILTTAPDIQGVETVESRLFGRDEAPPRARSAGPQGEALFSDKCDNCERHGRRCEDTRPCFECMEHNIVCYGTYMDNPYGPTDDDSDGSGNGWATFGPNFGLYD